MEAGVGLIRNGDMKTLLIGLGNPILGDDGVGWKVVEEVQKLLPPDSKTAVDYLSLGGISLMEHLIGYKRVILVDAFISEDKIGSVFVYKLDEIPNYSAFHVSSAHDMTLQSAIELGRWMGAVLPSEILVVGIATHRIIDFGEEFSEPVAQAIPRAIDVVLGLLQQLETAP
jgi:hydrogenase maturation protease